MGDDTQLGHASSLQSGQRVPDGKHYHGSPAVETHVGLLPDREQGASARCRSAFVSPRSSSPRWSSSRVPLPILAYYFWDQYSRPSAGIGVGVSALSLLGVSAALFFGSIVVGARCRSTLSRVSACCSCKPGVTYPAFGFHYLMQSIILRVSNSEFFCVLFGDSSFIVNYMR